MRRKKQGYHTPKIFQDAITVLIPLDVTADLKIAIKKKRAKIISSLYKKFPLLRKETKIDNKINKNDDEPMVGDEKEENAKEKDDKQPMNKKNKMENLPQPNQFGSVLDYLEAKYVKGVMLEENDKDGGPILDDKLEGQGSVYSRDSFLDDTDLQRDVAEQVMASTLTKLELEHEDDDFFFNVGTLEVENDYYGDNYDPLLDKENKTKTTKKRKKSSTAASTTSTKTSTSGASTTSASKSKKIKTEQQQKKQPTSTKSIKLKKSTGSTKRLLYLRNIQSYCARETPKRR